MSKTFMNRVATAARAATAAAFIGAAAAGAFAAPALASPAPQTESTGALYGHPDTAAQYWQMQHLPDNCVLMSGADVVGEVTGKLPSEEQIVRLAESTPSSMHPGSIYIRPTPTQTWGTDPSDVVVLLAQFGIKGAITNASTEEQTGVPTGLSAIERYLGDGHKVIATVNVETIWNNPDGDHSAPDHSLVITGVDTRTGVVHLNGPAYPSGADKQVPIDTFMQAWQASDYQMVVTVNDN